MKAKAEYPVDYEKGLENETERIKESTLISESNKKHILDFKEVCLDKGTSLCRIRYLLYYARITAEHLETIDFKVASEADFRKIYRKFRDKWADQTKWACVQSIMYFYRRLFKSEELPESVIWMKELKFEYPYKRPEEMFTREEIERIIDAETSFRNKTIISVLFESGARSAEFWRLKIKDVTFDDLGAILSILQTKGTKYEKIRPIRCISSAQYLRIYVEEHPFRDNPEEHLWINDNKDGNGNKKRLSKGSLTMLLNRAVKKTKITKKIGPHILRHSRATELAKLGFNEPQLREYFGWSRNSKEPSKYIHLAMKDLDFALAKAAGIPINEEEIYPRQKACPRCKEPNNPSTNLCLRCGWDMRTNIVDLLKSDIERKVASNNRGGMLPLKNSCPRCGFENIITIKFCGECGIPLHVPEDKIIGEPVGIIQAVR